MDVVHRKNNLKKRKLDLCSFYKSLRLKPQPISDSIKRFIKYPIQLLVHSRCLLSVCSKMGHSISNKYLPKFYVLYI